MFNLGTDEQFFYDNAGFCYMEGEQPEVGKRRCARALAEAEGYAVLRHWIFEWDYDYNADLSWMDEEERQKDHKVLYCLLTDQNGNILTSLWGNVDVNAVDQRVIEAELALEAMTHELDNFVC